MSGGTRRRVRGAAIATAALVAGVTAAAAWAGAFGLVQSPNPGQSNSIEGLVAFSPTDVWAIGITSSPDYGDCHGRTLTAHWDGTAFVEVPDSGPGICTGISGVSGTSDGDIWAVGSANEGRDTSVRRWNGTAWTEVAGAL